MIDLRKIDEEESRPTIDLTNAASSAFKPLSDPVAEERATRYAMALDSEEYPIDKVKSLLQSPYGEENLRTAAAIDEQNKRQSTAIEVFKNPDDMDAETLASVVQQAQKPVNPESVIERRFAEKVVGTSLAMTDNPEDVEEAYAKDPEMTQMFYDWATEEIAKNEILRKVAENRREQNKNASWGSFAWNFAESAIPFWTSTSQVNDALGEKLSSWLPGANVQEQIKYLQNAPADEFARLVTQIDAEMAASNPLEAEQFMQRLLAGTDYTQGRVDDAFAVFDAATSGILGTPAKVGRRLIKGKAAIDLAKTSLHTKNLLEMRSRLNDIPAADIKAGDARSAWLDANSMTKRIQRTVGAVKMPNAKVEDILSATGHTDAATKLKAKELAARIVGEGAAEPHKRGMERMTLQMPAFANPRDFLYDAVQYTTIRANEIAEELVKIQKNGMRLFDAQNIRMMPEKARDVAFELAETAWKKEMQAAGLNRAVLGVIERVSALDTRMNVDTLVATIGKKDQSMFTSADEAFNTGSKLYKLPITKDDIFQEGDKYVIKLTRPVSSNDPAIRAAYATTENATKIERNDLLWMVPEALWEVLPDIAKSAQKVPKAVSGAAETVSPLGQVNRAILAHGQSGGESIVNQMLKEFRDLPKQEFIDLKAIIEDARTKLKVPGDYESRGMYYNTAGELTDAYVAMHKRIPTDAEVKAYWSFLNFNNTLYVALVTEEFKGMSRMGVMSIKSLIKKQEVEFKGVVKDKLPDVDTEAAVYLAHGTGEYLHLSHAGVYDKLQRLIKDNKLSVIQTYKPDDPALAKVTGTHGPIHFVVVGNYRRAGLRLDQIVNYNPGGSIQYASKEFVTQPSMYRDSAGRQIFSGDKAILGATSRAEAEELGKLYERARQAYNKKDWAAFKQAVKEGIPVAENRLKAMFKKGELDPKVPFVVRRQGENANSAGVRTVNGKTLVDEIGNFTDYANSPFNLAAQNKHAYTSARDGRLASRVNRGTEQNPIWKVEEAPLVDFYQTQAEAMSKITRDRFYNDYQIFTAENFVREFKDLLTIGGKKIPEHDLWRNPAYYLANAVVEGSASDPRYASAVTIQKTAMNLLRHSSLVQRELSTFQAKLVDSAYKRSGAKAAETVDNWTGLFKKDPFSIARAAAFHLTMGFGNLVQVGLQGQTVFAINLFSPVHGQTGSYIASAMWRMGVAPSDEAFIDLMAKKAAKLTPGWTPEMFKDSYKYMKETRIDNVGREASWRNDNSDMGIRQSKAGAALTWSAGLVAHTERFVRMAAWNTAYAEYAAKFPKLAGKFTPTDVNYVLRRAEDLAMQMTRAGHASWQEGGASVITQFWGYTMRLFDSMTGMRFTKAERIRLLIGNSLLYGAPIGLSPLLPIWPWHTEVRQWLLENGIDPNEGLTGVAMNGVPAMFVSLIAEEITGQPLDYNLGERYGTQSLSVIHDLVTANWGETGMGDLVQTLVGASGTTIGRAITNTFPMISDLYYMSTGQSEWNTGVLAEDMNTVMSSISHWNNAQRAVAAWRTGLYRSRSKQVLAEGLTGMDAAFMYISGTLPMSVQDNALMNLSAREEAQMKSDASNEGKKWFRLYLQAVEDNDVVMAKGYMEKARIAFDMGGLTEDERMKIMLRLETPADDLIKNIFKRFTKNAPEDQLEDRKIMLEGKQ